MKLSFDLLTATVVLACSAIAVASDLTTYFPEDSSGVYIDWLEGASYSKSAFLHSRTEGKGVALHWTVDDNRLHIAVAGMANGWIGFGRAESGSMTGSDIVMFTAASGDLVDSYVLDTPGMPAVDDCQSWVLHNSTIEENFIIFEASRLLDTGDTQDRVFIDDSNPAVPATRVIAAWGDSSMPSYHGPDNTARSSVRFFGDSSSTEEYEAFARRMEAEAEGNFTMKANDFLIPPDKETTYGYFCFSEADLLALGVPIDQDLHTVGVEPVVDPRAKEYVHHFLVDASTEAWDLSLDCEEDFSGTDLAYVWAPGDLPMHLPENVGGPLGVSGFKSFRIEVHYNNPTFDSGILDSSGIRFFYTSKKRQYDLGVFPTGDPYVGLYGEPVSEKSGLAQHVFHCESACSESIVIEPLTVFREQLHMHKAGVSMSNEQLRNGEVVRRSEIEYWDFDQQGAFAVPQAEYNVLPGDAFRTTCNFNAANDTVWGLGSNDEMCIAYLFYFPRQPTFICGVGIGEFVPECEAGHNVTPNFISTDQLERSFGTSPSDCSATNTEGTSVTSSSIALSSDILMASWFALLVVLF